MQANRLVDLALLIVRVTSHDGGPPCLSVFFAPNILTVFTTIQRPQVNVDPMGLPPFLSVQS